MARFPVFLKGKWLYRIGGRICHRWHESLKDSTVITNLGIRDRYRMRMPGHNPQFACGNPMTYLGERGVLHLSSLLAPNADGIMDVGANWGYFTYFLCANLKNHAPLFFFEPNPKLFEYISGNVRQNGLKNVTGIKKGLSGKSGKAAFYINLTNDLCSTLDKSFQQAQETLVEETIEVTSFDDFAEQHNDIGNWLVKVDIENAEQEFVEGAAGKMERIGYLIMEMLEKARKAKLVDVLIRDFGFFAYYINDFTLEYMEKEDGHYSAPEYNFLFCRENPEELALKLQGSRFRIRMPDKAPILHSFRHFDP